MVRTETWRMISRTYILWYSYTPEEEIRGSDEEGEDLDRDVDEDDQNIQGSMSNRHDMTIDKSDRQDQDDLDDHKDDNASGRNNANAVRGNGDKGQIRNSKKDDNADEANKDRVVDDRGQKGSANDLYNNDYGSKGGTEWQPKNGNEGKNEEKDVKSAKLSQYRITSVGYQSNANLTCTCIGTIICLLFKAF